MIKPLYTYKVTQVDEELQLVQSDGKIVDAGLASAENKTRFINTMNLLNMAMYKPKEPQVKALQVTHELIADPILLEDLTYPPGQPVILVWTKYGTKVARMGDWIVFIKVKEVVNNRDFIRCYDV